MREEKERVICVEKRTWASPKWKKWRMASQGRLYTIFLKLSQPGFLCVRVNLGTATVKVLDYGPSSIFFLFFFDDGFLVAVL